jgi:predicted dehydrogenase/threonine dehydrogenase-like Zn-dependent dehydrogenase
MTLSWSEMKQLLQRYDSGEMRLADVPVPAASGVQLVVETRASLISAGTERAAVEVARANLLEKARQRPEQVMQVLDRVRTEGVASTMDAVRTRLREPVPLGYCSAGVVVDVGARARGFALGDRVATNGPHAEYVRVPHTLAAKVPDGVDLESAAFTPLAAIALQGIRMASPALGENVVVYGLGLVGLMTVQLLRANGCRVWGIDRAPDRLALGERFGATVIDGSAGDAAARIVAATNGIGADAVLLTLASTSDEPVHEAAAMSRKRGRLVLVGVTGLALRRDDFYRKELSFAVSCSYGPGRYDPFYEDEGNDYPIGFVRWTEQRNFEAVLHLMQTGALDVAALITHRFAFDDAAAAYDVITSDRPGLGVVLHYADRGGAPLSRTLRTVSLANGTRAAAHGGGGTAASAAGAPRVGRARPVAAVIGAGGFAQRVLIPAMRDAGFRLHTVASGRGTSAATTGETFGFERATTDVDAILEDPDIDVVFVLTRHDTHARMAQSALAAGKHVFVEKPLALTLAELDELETAAQSAGTLLTVGFNRRFAPLTQELMKATSQRSAPLALVITVNAGPVAPDHWTQHPEQGGGRILGEACHFIDLARAIVGAPIVAGDVIAARDAAGRSVDDIAHLSLAFGDGSTAAIHYLANGSRAFPKERIEAFVGGRTLVIDNWRRMRRYGGRAPLFGRAAKPDKGHAAELAAWFDAVKTAKTPPIPLAELFEVSRWSVRLAEAARGLAGERGRGTAADGEVAP